MLLFYLNLSYNSLSYYNSARAHGLAVVHWRSACFGRV